MGVCPLFLLFVKQDIIYTRRENITTFEKVSSLSFMNVIADIFSFFLNGGFAFSFLFWPLFMLLFSYLIYAFLKLNRVSVPFHLTSDPEARGEGGALPGPVVWLVHKAAYGKGLLRSVNLE